MYPGKADIRILNIQNASVSGSNTILVRTANIVATVIAIGLLETLNVTELWLWFGIGTNQRYIPIHSTAENLGSVKSSSMPYCSTGCDQVSFWVRKEERMEYVEAA